MIYILWKYYPDVYLNMLIWVCDAYLQAYRKDQIHYYFTCHVFCNFYEQTKHGKIYIGKTIFVQDKHLKSFSIIFFATQPNTRKSIYIEPNTALKLQLKCYFPFTNGKVCKQGLLDPTSQIWILVASYNKNKLKIRGCLVFKKSPLLTQFSSLVTHHLKYPNFLNPTRLAHIFSFSSLKIFYCLWDPCLTPHSDPSVNLPVEPSEPHHFSSLLIFPSPFSSMSLPKHKPPIKIEEPPSPITTIRHQGYFTHLSDLYRRRDLLRRDPAAPTKTICGYCSVWEVGCLILEIKMGLRHSWWCRWWSQEGWRRKSPIHSHICTIMLPQELLNTLNPKKRKPKHQKKKKNKK